MISQPSVLWEKYNLDFKFGETRLREMAWLFFLSWLNGDGFGQDLVSSVPVRTALIRLAKLWSLASSLTREPVSVPAAEQDRPALKATGKQSSVGVGSGGATCQSPVWTRGDTSRSESSGTRRRERLLVPHPHSPFIKDSLGLTSSSRQWGWQEATFSLFPSISPTKSRAY